MRQFIRALLTTLFVSVILAIVVAVLGEWFIEVARDKGWYQDAGQRWDLLASALVDTLISPLVLYPISVLGGLTAGLWLEPLLRRIPIPFTPYARPFKGAYPARLVFEFDRLSGKPRRIENHGIERFYVAKGAPWWVFIAFEHNTGTENITVSSNDGTPLNYEIMDRSQRSLVIQIDGSVPHSGLTIECENPRNPSKPRTASQVPLSPPNVEQSPQFSVENESKSEHPITHLEQTEKSSIEIKSPTRAEQRVLAKELDDLFAEGVQLRNQVQRIDFIGKNSDQSVLRTAHLAFKEWNDRTVKKLDHEFVPISLMSSFRTLDQFEVSMRIAASPGGHLRAMWSEKLKRLRLIIEKLEA